MGRKKKDDGKNGLFVFAATPRNGLLMEAFKTNASLFIHSLLGSQYVHLAAGAH